ncbi:MAG: response regulator transcription factor [Nitrosomonas oligotropha]|uniref:Response regulator transcription factor n=1 Tax=Nitrosomonas oligotropha TaxID=42354 RepID=A0A5C7W351_9PROT|nr:MAG: response regulator transcription factor [Nitrosomonas oligotropha]
MNVLFIEDHVLVRESLIYALKKACEHTFVIEASTMAEALRLVSHINLLDMVLLDIALPGVDGLTALPNLRQALGAHVPIIMLTGSDDPNIARKTRESGATECIHKSCNRNELISRIKFFMNPGLPSALQAMDRVAAEPLTPREMEVLQLAAQGDSDKIIAFKLGISMGTTKNHISRILLKLKVANRTGAVLKAITSKIIVPAA